MRYAPRVFLGTGIALWGLAGFFAFGQPIQPPELTP